MNSTVSQRIKDLHIALDYYKLVYEDKNSLFYKDELIKQLMDKTAKELKHLKLELERKANEKVKKAS